MELKYLLWARGPKPTTLSTRKGFILWITLSIFWWGQDFTCIDLCLLEQEKMWRDSFFSMFCSVKLISWKELQPEELHQIVNLKMITMGKVLRMSVTTGSGLESNRKNKTSRINMTTRNNLENLKQKLLEWEQKNQESFSITDKHPHNQRQMNSHTVLLRGIYKNVSKVFG